MNLLNPSHQLLANLHHAAFIKDKQLRYIAGNNVFMQGCGSQSSDAFIGKNDFDMPWKQYAKKYRLDDKLVLEGQTSLTQTEQHISAAGHTIQVRVSKFPLYENTDQPYGILCIYELLLPTPQLAFRLPKRQQQIWQLTAKGHNAKKIAHDLNLSVRTIEYYISILKQKLQCDSKSALIRKYLLANL